MQKSVPKMVLRDLASWYLDLYAIPSAGFVTRFHRRNDGISRLCYKKDYGFCLGDSLSCSQILHLEDSSCHVMTRSCGEVFVIGDQDLPTTT